MGPVVCEHVLPERDGRFVVTGVERNRSQVHLGHHDVGFTAQPCSDGGALLEMRTRALEIRLVPRDEPQHGVAGELDGALSARGCSLETTLCELAGARVVSLTPGEARGAPTGLRDESLRSAPRMRDCSLQASTAFGERAPQPPEAPERTDQTKLRVGVA